jgi:hypothetical protein
MMNLHFVFIGLYHFMLNHIFFPKKTNLHITRGYKDGSFKNLPKNLLDFNFLV